MGDRNIKLGDVHTQRASDVHTKNDIGRKWYQQGVDKREELPEYIQRPLRDFVKGNSRDQHDLSPDLKFGMDKDGKAYTYHGVQRADVSATLDKIKKDEPLRYAQLELDIKKNALAEILKKYEVNVDKEDVNGLKMNNGIYRFTDREGTTHEISQEKYEGNKESFEKIRKEVEAKITALGFKVDSMPVPDTIKKDVLGQAAAKETDETKKIALKEGTIYNYRYDKGTDEYKFTVMPREEHKDGEMLEVSIKLPLEKRTELTYQVEKHFISSEFGRRMEDVNQLKKEYTTGMYSYRDKGGEEFVEVLSEEQKGRLKEYRSSLGLDVEKLRERQAPESVGQALLKHAGIEGEAVVFNYSDPDLEKGERKFVVIQEGEKGGVKAKEISLSETEYKDIMGEKNAEKVKTHGDEIFKEKIDSINNGEIPKKIDNSIKGDNLGENDESRKRKREEVGESPTVTVDGKQDQADKGDNRWIKFLRAANVIDQMSLMTAENVERVNDLMLSTGSGSNNQSQLLAGQMGDMMIRSVEEHSKQKRKIEATATKNNEQDPNYWENMKKEAGYNSTNSSGDNSRKDGMSNGSSNLW